MLITPYDLAELRFAYCHHVYFRWRTHRRTPRPELAQLGSSVLEELLGSYEVHPLDATCSPTNVLLLLSLKPIESVSTAASKVKGRISKWLRERLGLAQPADLLSKGYFACTSGKSTKEAVEAYLDSQGDHHGYTSRQRPPVFIREFDVAAIADAQLQAAHAVSVVQYHLVLSTFQRRGVFSKTAGEAVVDRWQALEPAHRFALRKVSFVPDHVHIALRTHPSVSPAALTLTLMNAAQELMWRQFSDQVIRAGTERLWQPSAYIGSYGDLATPQIQQYLKNWESALSDAARQPKEPQAKPVGFKR